MKLCEKCLMGEGVVLLIIGISFLLRDLGIWTFWNVQWWTVGFLLLGATALLLKGCPNCEI